MKEYLTQRPKVIGIYTTNTHSLNSYKAGGGNSGWLCSDDMPYLPIFTYIKLATTQVKLASGKRIGDDIETINTNHNREYFSEEVLQSSKIDITVNDLLSAPVPITLNFTGTPLTITSHSAIAKYHTPITPLKTLAALEGKLVILQIHTLNTQSSLNAIYGINNQYLEQMRDKFVGRKDTKSVEAREIYDYVIRFLASSAGQSSTLINDTYKVATMLVIDANKVFEQESFKSKLKDTLCIPSLGFEITRLGPVEAHLHDGLADNFVHDAKIMATVREHGYSCFIVDNQKKLSPRFFNFAGKTQVIPSVENLHRLDGFYMLHLDATKKEQPLVFQPIESIDELPYIYDNQEMAEKGADVVQLRKDEIERVRAELHAQSLVESAEHARQMNALKEEKQRAENLLIEQRASVASEVERLTHAQRMKHESDMYTIKEERMRADNLAAQQRSMAELEATRVKAEQDAMIQTLKTQLEAKKQETDLFKYEFEQSRYRMDNTSMRMKQNYEEGKYERDSTIETIKTAGAVAGLLAGTYVLFNKFKS